MCYLSFSFPGSAINSFAITTEINFSFPVSVEPKNAFPFLPVIWQGHFPWTSHRMEDPLPSRLAVHSQCTRSDADQTGQRQYHHAIGEDSHALNLLVPLTSKWWTPRPTGHAWVALAAQKKALQPVEICIQYKSKQTRWRIPDKKADFWGKIYFTSKISYNNMVRISIPLSLPVYYYP